MISSKSLVHKLKNIRAKNKSCGYPFFANIHLLPCSLMNTLNSSVRKHGTALCNVLIYELIRFSKMYHKLETGLQKHYRHYNPFYVLQPLLFDLKPARSMGRISFASGDTRIWISLSRSMWQVLIKEMGRVLQASFAVFPDFKIAMSFASEILVEPYLN